MTDFDLYFDFEYVPKHKTDALYRFAKAVMNQHYDKFKWENNPNKIKSRKNRYNNPNLLGSNSKPWNE